ncbi:MAG: TetR/AcrR family transcriptional regulator [Gloeobacteraceae cyanobacterium ES-bin-316]|nr:TetR/AcrR family transcriptional regulator [Ferruginibacter sp.]
MAKIKAGDSGSKKDAILKKAATLFRTKGFKASSMRELALKIGVEAPSLYNHIGSKSELLQSICFKVAAEFNSHLQNVEASDSTATSKLERLIRFHIQMMLQSFDEVYVSNHEWKYLEEPHLAGFLQQRKHYEASMLQLVKTGIEKKELKNIHPHVAVLTILSAVRGLEFWQRYKKEIDATLLEDNMVNHLLTGIKK